MKLIVGLGNPGEKYIDTRHNIGFMAIDALARVWQADLKQEKKFSARIFLSRSDQIILAQPSLFMNQSGIAVARIARFYKVAPQDIWVIHDDVDLVLEKLKIVQNRGTAGHKGVFSIIQQLGTTDFVRFRLGVGRPHSGQAQVGGKKASKFDDSREVTDFVLAQFLPTEADEVKKLIKKTTRSVEIGLEKGIEAAMNQYN
ncbi:aminoacyl-tRNA hydrolase [Patescibacteria group bacterium]